MKAGLVQSKYYKSFIIVSQLEERNEGESNRSLPIDLLEPHWPILLCGSTPINITETMIIVDFPFQQKKGPVNSRCN